ncbi:hypothetical protein [Streptomyces adustus]|uniref:hypothetical protein n=1 Tax=Streptomyces adustus TaxID=1609272 RepID=UPI0012E0202F|nr:hypothetical protein [Streptomyces adustus]
MTHSPIDLFTPAVELAAAIRRKEVSPVEVVDRCLERMDALNRRGGRTDGPRPGDVHR